MSNQRGLFEIILPMIHLHTFVSCFPQWDTHFSN